MSTINQVRRFSIVLLVVFITVLSCATVPDLNVLYRLSVPSDALRGKGVSLRLEDVRTTKDFLGDGAKKEFKYFSENVSFSVAQEKESGFQIGRYEIPALILEGFKRRLKNLGIEIALEGERGRYEMVIFLKTFTLDLVGRTWKVEMGYEARLMMDGKMLAKQSISGQGERYKVWGKDEAEVLLGEIFSDSINRLDVVNLFNQVR